MSRYTDLDLDEIIELTGWDEDSLLHLSKSFIRQRGLLSEFTDFCREWAEDEMKDNERLEDMDAEKEEDEEDEEEEKDEEEEEDE